MKIKIGEKLPFTDFYYLDEKNTVKKINSSTLLSKEKRSN